MNKYNFILIILLASFSVKYSAQEIIIQENDLGFCNVDGSIQTSVTGYTGIGYADTDRGIGKSISWNIEAEVRGKYLVWWRYANGGGTGDRPARLLINGNVYLDTVNFAHTGVWTNWTNSDTIEVEFTEGNNKLRLEAYSVDGLGNYDYFVAMGAGIKAAECTPSYTLSAAANNVLYGSINYEPVRTYYDAGSVVTLYAHANPGYFFQSWTGYPTSADSIFTFTVTRNINATARFLPIGAAMEKNIAGYATVQDDAGTSYLVTGGALGDTVNANTLEELKNFLSSEEHLVVTFSKKFEAKDELKIKSNKTIFGLGDSAHLKGIEIEINDARNVIIKNIKVSHVTPADAIVITGKSQNIWIDHCDLFSDKDHGVDYYDGLLDIKNESSFITVSWCKFHDHFKTSLISSGDDSIQDTVIRVTYHHNYFYNCGSRLPSIRFGKAHIFNNYYRDNETAINSRMGACVRVERNYFENVGKAVFMDFSPEKGSVQLIENHFGGASYESSPECDLNIPYNYDSFLDETEQVPIIITGELTTAVYKNPLPASFNLSNNYPNPFNPSTNITYSIPIVDVLNRMERQHVILKIYDTLGREVATLVNERKSPGNYEIEFNASGLTSGIYFYSLSAGTQYFSTKKMILIK